MSNPSSSKNDVFATDPEQWTNETIEEAGARLRPIVERFRKVRGDLATADTKAEAEKKEKKAKKTKKPGENLDLEGKL